ncbi:MAG: DNA mismatch repair protein MutS [Eubacteriales bacterium]|nr:DNA mismatch repair protein MutS [Eubacteriales bacterium]
MAYTPMMQQYLNIKEQYRDCILFFRLGDFYEMFFEDAVIGARDMEITLTKKSCGEEERAPMCGVPYHAADTYIAKLIEKGHKVAICEQTEDPSQAKGIVRREVVRVITPGTILSQSMLSEKENNFLASVYVGENSEGLTYCDISTGEFAAVGFSGISHQENLMAELAKIGPKEILINALDPRAEAFSSDAGFPVNAYLSPGKPEYYMERNCRRAIREHFRTESEGSVGLDRTDTPGLFYATGALLGYLKDTQKQSMAHLTALRIYTTGVHMSLDRTTLKNLEITESLSDRKNGISLLHILDKTCTAMGSRKMKQWLKEPLVRKEDIDDRLNAVEHLTDDLLRLNNIREALKSVYDLERLSSRIACGTANGRDLNALKNSLRNIPDIKTELANSENPLLEAYDLEIDALERVCERIDAAVTEEPPVTIREGDLIREAYSDALDLLKDSIKDGRAWIASLEPQERERTGIKSLKVGYNKVFGYYLEVSKSNVTLVPQEYIRKQTLVNCERYITPELKEIEAVVLNAEAKINELEYQLFTELRQEIAEEIPAIQRTSAALAAVDVLTSFAEAAIRMGYRKPSITTGERIIIQKGRHAVIERTIRDGVFVSNDVYLDRSDASLLLITGPNMSGKSTYMRQLALIVLMAQAGCFIPAESAEIGICDRIYTRIGAMDNLAQGQSTFFVEMSELAYILNTSTEKSLVILDEIGRGTSTYDGLSIAWAVCEHLTRPEKKIRTLFATHYHELTTLAETMSGLRNLNVDVTESDGTIVFLHKIVEGSASRSYGIHVARLAGVPESLLYAAENKLSELEHENTDPPLTTSGPSKRGTEEEQISLFGSADKGLVQKLLSLDLMETTPSMAIEILQELQNAAKEG